MNDYIFFMHDDVPDEHRRRDDEWPTYLAKLSESGAFEGGSSIGNGIASKSPTPAALTRHISGYIRTRAASLDAARELVLGNPI